MTDKVYGFSDVSGSIKTPDLSEISRYYGCCDEWIQLEVKTEPGYEEKVKYIAIKCKPFQFCPWCGRKLILEGGGVI